MALPLSTAVWMRSGFWTHPVPVLCLYCSRFCSNNATGQIPPPPPSGRGGGQRCRVPLRAAGRICPTGLPRRGPGAPRTPPSHERQAKPGQRGKASPPSSLHSPLPTQGSGEEGHTATGGGDGDGDGVPNGNLVCGGPVSLRPGHTGLLQAKHTHCPIWRSVRPRHGPHVQGLRTRCQL